MDFVCLSYYKCYNADFCFHVKREKRCRNAVIIKLIFVFSPDVRAFLQMDSPKHQSDPSEDEDERSTQKVVRGIVFFNRKKKIPLPKDEIIGNLRSHIYLK